MMNKQKLHNALTDAFIRYQFRLDHPFPIPEETFGKMVRMYHTDRLFHNKVDQLACGVMGIVDEVLEDKIRGMKPDLVVMDDPGVEEYSFAYFEEMLSDKFRGGM